ncbi:hypothetical protein CALVIDRAFT_597797 [Calocera viscosa TUFC12733]|uniref:Uncharacterized protein n=1 Tax=Calocera viscosa (strain TUFC12733) TaxID=1330018 RepID=A0A167MUH3_CALVF|nr:hypothetical protein CALVIDRAFT_597797 [Calocera viscosa TUFC12733]
MPLPALSPSLQTQHHLLSSLLRPLRRTRPHVPFWKLAAHRQPTLSLYRDLWRFAPSTLVRDWVRYKWDLGRHETSPGKTRALLDGAERVLRVFFRAWEGGEREREVLDRYERLIYAKGRRNEWRGIENRELQRLHALYNRPIVVGNVTYGTPHNKPFPMLKPQPRAISRIIAWRIRARDRRMGAQGLYMEWKGWVLDEIKAERMLGLREGTYVGHEKEWLNPIYEHVGRINRSFEADYERQHAPLTAKQVSIIRSARRERVRNLTYQRQRELRGEMTRRLRLQRLQGPPAPVLARWGERERMEDRMVRGAGWGGYAGEVKLRRGMTRPREWGRRRWGKERRRKLGLEVY